MHLDRMHLFLIFILLNVYTTSTASNKPSIKNLVDQDSICYVVQISIEFYSRTETLTVKKMDSLYYASIKIQSTIEEENLNLQNVLLNKVQVDTLIKFEKSVYSQKISHNQGLKIAGRIGRYFILYHNKNREFESRELYGLVKALGIKINVP